MAIDIDGVVHMGALSISSPWNTPGISPTSGFEPARPACVWKLDHSFNVVDLYVLGVDYTLNEYFPTSIDVDESNNLLFLYGQGWADHGGDTVIAIDTTDGSVAWSYDNGTNNHEFLEPSIPILISRGAIKVFGDHVYVSGEENTNWDGAGSFTVTPSSPATNAAVMWKLDKLTGNLIAARNGKNLSHFGAFDIAGNNIFVARRSGSVVRTNLSFNDVWQGPAIFSGVGSIPGAWGASTDLSNGRSYHCGRQSETLADPPGEAGLYEVDTSDGSVNTLVKFASGAGTDVPWIRDVFSDGTHIYICGQAGSVDCPGVVKFTTGYSAVWSWDIRTLDVPGLDGATCNRLRKHSSSIFIVGDATPLYAGNSGADPIANIFKLADSDGSLEAVGCVGRHPLFDIKVTNDYVYVGSTYPTRTSNPGGPRIDGPLNKDYVRRPARLYLSGVGSLPYVMNVVSGGGVRTFQIRTTEFESSVTAGVPFTWSISEACSWVSVSPTSGDEDDALALTVSVTIAANTGPERQCVLTLSTVEPVDDSPATVTIIQAAV